MTPEETFAYNRRTAANVIRARLGLADVAPADWTYIQRVTYNRELGAYIADNPQAFSNSEIQVAKEISHKIFDPLDDTGAAASLALFGDELLNEAQATLDTGGRTLRLAVYIAAAVAAAVYVLPYALRAWQKSAPTK